MLIRVPLLFVAGLVCFMVAGAVSPLAGGSTASDPEAGASLMRAMLVTCGCVTLVVSFIVLRARASGWPLAAALALATFGSMTFMYDS